MNILFFYFPQTYIPLRISEFKWLFLIFINAIDNWIAHRILIVNNLDILIFLRIGNITGWLLIGTFQILTELFLKFSFIRTEIIDHVHLIIIHSLGLWHQCFSHYTAYVVYASTKLTSKFRGVWLLNKSFWPVYFHSDYAAVVWCKLSLKSLDINIILYKYFVPWFYYLFLFLFFWFFWMSFL